MQTIPSNLEGTGLEVVDLFSDPAFAIRHLHDHNIATQMEAMRCLADAFVQNPDTVLDQLVHTAVEICGAESAGISVEGRNEKGEATYHWIATAGKYAPFLNALLPAYPSACGVCIKRGSPQIFRASQKFFDDMQVEAPIVTDGILIPWQTDEQHGTVWIMSHSNPEAFDVQDVQLMELLADFAAMAIRQQRQQKLLLKQATVAAAVAMANELAHGINNPLQKLTNLVFLAAQSESGSEVKQLAQELSKDLDMLGALVKKLLDLPLSRARENA